MERKLVRTEIRKDYKIEIYQVGNKFEYEVTDPKGEDFATAGDFLSADKALKDAEEEIIDNGEDDNGNDLEDWRS